MFFYSADVCWVIVFDVIQCINSLAETRHPQCYRWSLQILACCFMWLSAFHRRLDHILLYKHCFYNDTWFEHSLAIKFGSNHSKHLFVSFALCLYFSFLFFRCQVWSGHWPSWLCDSLWLTMFSWSWWLICCPALSAFHKYVLSVLPHRLSLDYSQRENTSYSDTIPGSHCL